MAQQTFARGLLIPWWGTASSGAPGLGSLATDANDEVAAFIFRAPKAGNIRAVWFWPSVGTGADRTIGIYQVDATTGSPSTPPTAWAANTFVVKSIVAGDNQDFISSGAFTADAVVAKGDLFAVCFITPAATPGNITFSRYSDGLPEFPYGSLFTGSWAKSTGPGNILLEYSDGSFEIPLGGIAWGNNAGVSQPVTTTFSNSSTPDVRGARFQFPGPVRVNGAWLWVDSDGNYDVYLVDAAWDGTSGDALAAGSVDLDVRASTAAGIVLIEFGATVDLTAATNYRLVVVPSTTTNLSLYHYDCVSAGHLGAQPLGANFHLTTAKDPNDDTDWTNYNNGTDGYKVPLMGLVLDGISDGAGAGGGGGIRLAGHGGLAA